MEILVGSSYMNTDGTIFNVESRDKLKSYSNIILYPANENEELENQLIIETIEPIIENELKKFDYEIDYDKEEIPEDDYMHLCEIKTYNKFYW